MDGTPGIAQVGENVQFPASALNSTGQDIAGPTVKLLQQLELLPIPTDKEKGVSATETPYSLQVITAGALKLSKVWAVVIGAVGGGTAGLTAIQGFLGKQDLPIRITYVAGAAAVLAIAAVSVALIVRADVDARAQTSIAQYSARAAIASVLLQVAGGFQSAVAADGSDTPDATLALLASSGRLRVSREADTASQPVSGVRKTSEGVQLRIPGDWVSVHSIKTFELVLN